jgi:SAM-dependent methyltransferase
MTGQPMNAPVRDGGTDADAQARDVLRLFEGKAVTWAAKYAPEGPLVGRLGSFSAAVGRYAQAGDRVLELGCGTGDLARTLAAAGLQVTGCDISPQMLRVACDHGGCARWVRLGPDWRRLPFISAAFDVVVASSVLEYVADPLSVLCECARVLRPGGVVLYTVPDLRHPVRWAEWLARRLAIVSRAPSGYGPPSRCRGYHAYLRASRQRHRVRWWLITSGLVGLHQMPCPADDNRSALRLLVFRHSGEHASRPLISSADESGLRP